MHNAYTMRAQPVCTNNGTGTVNNSGLNSRRGHCCSNGLAKTVQLCVSGIRIQRLFRAHLTISRQRLCWGQVRKVEALCECTLKVVFAMPSQRWLDNVRNQIL